MESKISEALRRVASQIKSATIDHEIYILKMGATFELIRTKTYELRQCG